MIKKTGPINLVETSASIFTLTFPIKVNVDKQEKILKIMMQYV